MPTSVVSRLPSVVCRLFSVVCRLSSLVCRLSSVVYADPGGCISVVGVLHAYEVA